MSGLPGLQYEDDIVPPSPKRVRLEERAQDEDAEFEQDDDDDFYDDGTNKPRLVAAPQPGNDVDMLDSINLASTNGLPGLAFTDAAIASDSPPQISATAVVVEAVETPQAEDVEEANFYEETPVHEVPQILQTTNIESTPLPPLEMQKDADKVERTQTHIEEATVTSMPKVETPVAHEQPVKQGLGKSILDDLDFMFGPPASDSPTTVVLAEDVKSGGSMQQGTEQSNGIGIEHSARTAPLNGIQSVPSSAVDTSETLVETEPLGQPVTSAAVGPEPVAEDKEEFLAMAEANKGNPNAEWQLDSSDAASTDSSGSSDSSSDDDDEDDDDGELLDPETQAKMLLEAIGDDDDGPAPSGPLKTVNEKEEEILPKPDITVTPEMEITELGFVDNIVLNFMLIKGVTSGNYRVVEAGSALCLEDRTVIGAVMEPMGRVQQPMYSMGFKDLEELTRLGVTQGTKVFYVNDHSSYVFTEPLKAFKGTDASNIHDEETGVEEIEFSDDEKEAEYKRNAKQAKQGRKGNDTKPSRQDNKQGQGNKPAPFKHPDAYASNQHSRPISYDDDDEEEDGEEIYHRLNRPDNLHEMMTFREPVEDRANRGRPGRGGRGNDRAGRDRGGRGGRGGQRGGRGGGQQQNFDRGGKRGRGQRGNFQNNNNNNNGNRQSPQHQSPKGKGRRDYSNSPRPSSARARYEESTSNPQRTPPPMPPPNPRYPEFNVQSLPPPPHPSQLNPATLMQMMPQAVQFNPQLFNQNAMQHAPQPQYPADPRLRNAPPPPPPLQQQQQQPQQHQQPQWPPYPPPPPPRGYQPPQQQQQYQAYPQAPYGQQAPQQPGAGQPQLDLNALLRNLAGGNARQ